MCISTIFYCFKNGAPLCHPMRTETKTNRASLAQVFPRFCVGYMYVEGVRLVHRVFFVLRDWLEWLLWFSVFSTLINWKAKYARIFVLGHYLFLKAYSFHPAALTNSCSLLGTDNVRRQISELVFAPRWRPLSVYSAFQLMSVEKIENQSNHSSQSRNTKKTRWTNQTPSTYM